MPKRGKPPWEVTEFRIKQAFDAAAEGLTENQIAGRLGISQFTLIEKKKVYPELAEAIKKGQAQAIGEIENALFLKARKGDTISMIFFLKARAGWRDADKAVQNEETPGFNVGQDKPPDAERQTPP